MRARQETYIGLDVIRFAAALAVAFYHLAWWWWLPEQDGSASFREAFSSLTVRWGFIGVPVFFVLSGFIIAASALDRTATEFLKGRVLRLYPAAWICCAVTVAVIGGSGLGSILRTVALWPTGPWVSGVYWTLGVEIVFYALVTLALSVNIRLWSLGAVLGTISSVFWILRAVDYVVGSGSRYLFVAIEGSTFGQLLIVHGCYFGIGIALWSINRRGWRLSKAILLPLFIIGGFIAAFQSSRFEGGGIEAPLIWLAAVGLIAASIRFQSVLWRWFGRWGPAIRTTGLATYPLYLVHNEVGHLVMVRSGLEPMAALGLALLVVVGLAYLIVKLERWPRAWLRHLLSVKQETGPAAQLP